MTTNLIFEKTNAIEIDGNTDDVDVVLSKINTEEDVQIYDLEFLFKETKYPEPISLKWKIPATDSKGIWKPTTDFNKRLQADWELHHMQTRISIDAPVISVFGNDDKNRLTFACSNAVNTLEMNARIREEDNNIYCHITFFSEKERQIKNFRTQIRLDYRNLHFSESLKQVSQWWESYENLKPACVPSIAREPLYSTWYQFHQDLDARSLRKECELAYSLGYKSIIIDDGWQTHDTGRGYDYTGDWKPDRFPDMAGFIHEIQRTGMKAAIWYSVPFCGKKSEAYQKFKGKFLTENHRWAPVFDPRYPEVREYLVSLYKNAVSSWKLDGLKLDFIDDFRIYPDTPLGEVDGRDYSSINEAVDRLLCDVATTLKKVNPDIFIEFRQKYIGPAIRKYGTMLRAFDCPGDATMNRVRIADIKMLCGESAVHSDMVTWHPKEDVEVAALQLINTLFGVPQLSIMLHEASQEHVAMIAFYTKYWSQYSDILLHGNFTPSSPLANYPIQSASKDDTIIVGVYENYIIDILEINSKIHIHNGSINDKIVIRNTTNLGSYHTIVYDCMGNIVKEQELELSEGLLEIALPPCGILIAEKV